MTSEQNPSLELSFRQCPFPLFSEPDQVCLPLLQSLATELTNIKADLSELKQFLRAEIWYIAFIDAMSELPALDGPASPAYRVPDVTLMSASAEA